MEKKKDTNTWHDWKRTIISTATIVATLMFYYYNDKSTMQTNLARLETNLNSHCMNSQMYTMPQLDERFVLRREWDNSKSEILALRDEIRYLRNKIDVIYEKITDKKI